MVGVLKLANVANPLAWLVRNAVVVGTLRSDAARDLLVIFWVAISEDVRRRSGVSE